MPTPVAIAARKDSLSRIGRALADPSRQRLLLGLLEGVEYSSDLAAAAGLGRANTSNHLTCLRECGLVLAYAEGRRVRYELASPALVAALQALTDVELVPLAECDR